ncbi:Ait1p NDAI_0A03010 [Naumovozyma dairenensis CBS 421]|uniref:Uncharacterized protein n=1 Tax=Naumovozyma dairenensis (strain ATCC 10597 / BCRC 20456 / CBS 421 / NBRC 0211 / NRRL Y-12639) TaxID=1071378 RepID=G0W3S0_NAUDC|nr:hypothetical protein NDAI_0A03010 [Naumovozyma dairenensis CBS 421]CCD22458.1 hypothetical protein NDAI_0A03010 [Naumovozyma dairenensis CBS 421]
MVRLSHSTSYFMPLFCSKNAQIVIVSSFVSIFLFIFMYWTSDLLSNRYNEPGLFNPNSQDYFRTSLLGLFSPFLYYFIRTFLFNINQRYLVLNIIVDFPLNDWFMFCILVTLAYPQVQDPKYNQTFISNGNLFKSGEYWQIIPRQAYIFGISWALGEFSIGVLENLFTYQEIPKDNSNGNGISQIHSDNIGSPILDRKKISLSMCVDVRRQSSKISDNVYCSKSNHGYGSSSTSKLHTNDGSVSADEESPIVVINSADNSLKIISSKLEGQSLADAFDDNTNIATNGNLNDTIDNEYNPIKYFYQITKTKDFLFQLLQMCLIILANIFLLTGESLMMSIYFIYVPGHEGLFTAIVNYFGLKPIGHFLLALVLPFTAVNFIANFMIFYFKDLKDWFNDAKYIQELMVSDNKRPVNNSHTSEWPQLESEPLLSIAQKNTFANFDTMFADPIGRRSSIIQQYRSNSIITREDDDEQQTGGLLKIAKRIFRLWKRTLSNDTAVLIATVLWGSTVFITAILLVLVV